MTPFQFAVYSDSLFENKLEQEKENIEIQIIGAYFGEMMSREKRLKKLNHYLKMLKFDNEKIKDDEIKKAAEKNNLSDEELKKRFKEMGIVGW